MSYDNMQLNMFKQPKEKILKELTGNIVTNVRYLCNKKGIKVSDVEDAINAKHGYFMSAKNKDNSPSIEKVAITAMKLEVSIDELCFGDFERNEIEKEISDHEEKLKELRQKLEGKK